MKFDNFNKHYCFPTFFPDYRRPVQCRGDHSRMSFVSNRREAIAVHRDVPHHRRRRGPSRDRKTRLLRHSYQGNKILNILINTFFVDLSLVGC